MRNRTELMQSILTNETAQRIIDFVSPLYGNSYVGLWLFQAIGTALDDVCKIADQIRYETNAATADLLLGYWEKQYGLPDGSGLTKAQRRDRIISKKLNQGPCNTARMCAAISAALGGADVEITENVAQNTFLVNVRDIIDSIVPAVAVIERMKPAHLIYQIRVATQTVSDADIKLAIAMTYAEHYRVDVRQAITPEGITVDYDDVGLVTMSIPGCTVSYDENGTVTLSGISAEVTYDDNGNVMIGG